MSTDTKQAANGIRPDKREALTMERVVETALLLVDRDGLGKLSMRKLGAELGVDPMAVYHYIPNKAALLDGLIEAVMNELGVAPEREKGESVPDWLVRIFTLFWERLRAHPHALPVMATRPMTGESAMRSAERILTELRSMGLPAEDGMSALMAMTTMTIGLALAESGRQPENMDPHVIEKIQAYYASLPPAEFPLMLAGLQCKPMADWGITFDFCIRTFTAGLMATYGSGKAKPADGVPAPSAG
jgi:TetR/AcrR family tetracycline transcriptional repressor